jgi:hypothetical protein
MRFQGSMCSGAQIILQGSSGYSEKIQSMSRLQRHKLVERSALENAIV